VVPSTGNWEHLILFSGLTGSGARVGAGLVHARFGMSDVRTGEAIEVPPLSVAIPPAAPNVCR
jgi:hypothetical protein